VVPSMMDAPLAPGSGRLAALGGVRAVALGSLGSGAAMRGSGEGREGSQRCLVTVPVTVTITE
jgi:hypothetical protein